MGNAMQQITFIIKAKTKEIMDKKMDIFTQKE